MIPIYEFNRVVVLISTLRLEKRNDVGTVAVSDAIERMEIEGRNISPQKLLQNSVDLGLINNKSDRLSLTNNGNRLLKLQKIENDQIILDDLTKSRQFFVELIFNSQNLKTDLENIFNDFRIHHGKKIWFYDSKPDPNWNEHLLSWLAICNFWNVIDNEEYYFGIH